MHIHHLPWVAVTILATTGLARGSGEATSLPRAEGLAQNLASWRAHHGPSWRVRTDPRTGHAELLFGGRALPVFQPDTTVEGDWFTLARHGVASTEELFGVSEAELVDERFVYLPLGMANGTDKITVRLSQVVNGLPVEGAAINALFDTEGRLLSLHSTASPFTDDLPRAASFSGRAAVRLASDSFAAEAGVPALEVGPPLLLYAQVDRGAGREALLAYQVTVLNPDVPAGMKYTISATDGAILRRDDVVHDFDVFGTVKSMATPGNEADHAGNPPVELPMSYIYVTSSAGTVAADRDGNFVFPGVTAPLDVTVEFKGTFNEVFNQQGADYSITFAGLQPDVQNDLLMNPSPDEFTTAQANVYQHMNVVRDYVRDTTPTDSTADFQATSKPNIADSCNAFFDGSSVKFYAAGGNCNNMGFSSVVAHELGHWLNDLYGTGNDLDGMGEGNSDVFSMYVYDDHAVGRYVKTSGGWARSGLNTRQFCGDDNGGCHGSPHKDGQVWMGAAWKVRRNLKATLGTALGGATADQLFMSWMNAYNQTRIKSLIELQWLTLDDDDGNLDNGTPNYADIDGAFREQGFPGFDLPCIQIGDVTELPDVATDSGPYTVSAQICGTCSGITTADLLWRANGGAWSAIPMSPAGGACGYTAEIPAVGEGRVVQYYLSATDAGGNLAEYPHGGMDAPLEFAIGTPQVLLSWDFEATTDEGWVGGLGDTATTGFWEREDPNGTPAQPEDDHTPGAGNVGCWFTGQGTLGGPVSENDVDDGRVNLDSPVIDMSGLSGVQVRYWRWFSNDEGGFKYNDEGATYADTFRVRLSFDGGVTYTTVESVGPDGPEVSGEWFEGGFTVDAYGTPGATMRIRFVAADSGEASTIEAALDDVVVTYLDSGSGCPLPSNYCIGAPNSAGQGAVMDWSGSQNVDDADFTLLATGCPPNQFGFFFYGVEKQQTPVGNGFLCVSGTLYRLPVAKSDALGVAAASVDFSNPPNAGDILNGSTWNFQFGYRDNPGGGAGFNFSDGLQVSFCD